MIAPFFPSDPGYGLHDASTVLQILVATAFQFEIFKIDCSCWGHRTFLMAYQY